MGVRERMQLARLAVTLDPSESDLGTLAHELFGGGVDLIQLRPGSTSTDAALAEAVEVVRTASYDYQGLVALTDAVDVAVAVAIDVLHLDVSKMSAQEAAANQHEWALVGRSCVSRNGVDDAIADAGVDYFFVDPDLIGYAATCACPSTTGAKPWFATGGLTLDNLDEALRLGARRVCIDACSDNDLAVTATEFKRALRDAWQTDPDLPELGVSLNSTPRPRFRRPGEPPVR